MNINLTRGVFIKRIKANNLKNWASTRECQENLPLLIRRLIHATVKDIIYILFPAGESIINPGYDGLLNVYKGTTYVPDGCSVWELGCGEDIKIKANSDYNKRKKDPLNVDPSKTTFVFVTPRRWRDKTIWIEEKRKESFWKDVRAYDADNLEDWIEQTIAVSIWFAQHLQIYPGDVVSLDHWWENWSNSTNPPLIPNLILASRDHEIRAVQDWLRTPSSIIMVQADTEDESIAFLASVIYSLPEKERESHLSRSLITETSHDFRHVCITSGSNLIVIAGPNETEWFHSARKKGHCVYVPLSPENNIPRATNLSRIGKEQFISALIEMGISEEMAKKYSKDTKREITILRRQLSLINTEPEWGKIDSVKNILPVLLAGSWIESKKSDEEIISLLANESYESFSKKLYTLQHKPDSPILKIGDLWQLRSPEEAWYTLARFITHSDIETFKEIFLDILKTKNPSLELDPEKRWMAAVCGKIQKYSDTLRKGICQSVIFIALCGDDVKIPLSTTSQTWVDNLVRELLHKADCDLWNSLLDVLQLIAEASPTSFMDAIENSLTYDEKPIMCLFEESEGLIGPSTNHSSLLWALEILAWMPNLLSRVTMILGQLAKYDPHTDSRVINRPKNSLRGIFLLWNPQTYSSLEKRLDILDVLVERYPEIGWNLLIDLMPKNHDIGYPTSKPVWRQISEKTDMKITISEIMDGTKEIVNRLLSNVGNDGARWVKILDNYSELPRDERNRIRERLSCDTDKILIYRYELWIKLRKIISRHRSYPDAEWALPEEELKNLEEIYLSLEPEDMIDKFGWLFDGLPDLLEGIDIVKRHDDEHFIKLRINALNEIRNEYGFEGLVRLAERIKSPIYLGRTLAEDNIDPIEEEKLYSLLEENESKMIFVKEYIFRKAFNDNEWIKNLVNKSRTENWSNLKIANFFTALPSRMFVWNLLKSFNENIQKEYWKKCGFGGITAKSEDKIYYIKQMVKFKRYFNALDIAALYAEEIPSELIIQILEKAATEQSEDEFRIDYYDIEKLFEELYKSNYQRSEIAKLEWYYLAFLASVTSRRPPKMLHNELTNNPEFFLEVIKHVYKRKDENEDDDGENISPELLKQRATLSLKLLRSWKSIPGSTNGQINYTILKSWIDKSRELCVKSDRIDVCDIQIGQLLANAEFEEDIWPPEAICKIIDSIPSEKLHTGFKIGVSNKRGVFTKSLDEGGKQEKALSEKYKKYADKLNIRFPKTASILYDIAADYNNQAKIEDEEVEKWDLEY